MKGESSEKAKTKVLQKHNELRDLAYESGYYAGRMEQAAATFAVPDYDAVLKSTIKRRNAISREMEEALAASEQTDLERFVAWLPGTRAEAMFCLDTSGARMIDFIVKHIADEFGVGGKNADRN